MCHAVKKNTTNQENKKICSNNILKERKPKGNVSFVKQRTLYLSSAQHKNLWVIFEVKIIPFLFQPKYSNEDLTLCIYLNLFKSVDSPMQVTAELK